MALSTRSMPGFDEAYYLRSYPDVAQFGGTPLEHYLEYGWKEGRDPSAGFSTDGYLAVNGDVRENGGRANAGLTRPDSAPFGQATRPDRQGRQS